MKIICTLQSQRGIRRRDDNPYGLTAVSSPSLLTTALRWVFIILSKALWLTNCIELCSYWTSVPQKCQLISVKVRLGSGRL